jgi:RHS repeat-associated protein
VQPAPRCAARAAAAGHPLRDPDLLRDGDDNLRQANELSPTAGTPFTAAYNGAGLRVKETDNWTGTPGTHNFTWGLGGVLLDDAGTEYTPGFSERQTGADQFYDTDWLGSTRYLGDVTGIYFNAALRFDAFGNRSATGNLPSPYDPTDFQFGAEWGYQTSYANTMEPGLGLQYLEQRYYDPAIGRFISADPVGFDGGLNLYGYCGNDAVNGADPLGTIGPGKLAFGTAVGGTVGFVVGAGPVGALGERR